MRWILARLNRHFKFFLAGCPVRDQRRNWLLATPETVSGGPIFTCGGFLELRAAIPLFAPSSGVVSEIFIHPTQKVMPGQLILKISQPELEKSLFQISGDLAGLKKEAAVNRQLLAAGLIEKSQMEPLAAKMAVLENSQKNIKQQIEILSPGSGWLAWLDVGRFSWVNQGQLLGYVLPLRNPEAGHYRVRVEVPDYFLENVRPGQKILVTGKNIGRLAGQVLLVAPFVRETGSISVVEVLGKIIQPPEKTLIKMPVEISFLTGDDNLLRIPRLAVSGSGAESFIYLLTGSVPRKQVIYPLFTGDEFVYLSENLELKKAQVILNFEAGLNAGD